MGEEIEVGPRMRAAGATMSLVVEVLLLTGGVRSPGAHARFVKWLTDDSGKRGCVSAISPESRGLRRSKGLSLNPSRRTYLRPIAAALQLSQRRSRS
jgi:hypothetical protein